MPSRCRRDSDSSYLSYHSGRRRRCAIGAVPLTAYAIHTLWQTACGPQVLDINTSDPCENLQYLSGKYTYGATHVASRGTAQQRSIRLALLPLHSVGQMKRVSPADLWDHDIRADEL
jgi:hypothetical protein